LTDTSVHPDPPFLLTMVGGGSDGGQIALTAARAEIPAGHRHIILTGPQMPQDDYQRVVDAASASAAEPHRVQVSRSAPHVPRLIREAAGVVSMGGYNSLAEIMATTTPALIIPRSSRRHEQPRRAAALARVGVVDSLAPHQM